MLGAKCTYFKLTKVRGGLYSKEGLGKEEVLLPGVEILLLDPSLLVNYSLTFPFSTCMIKRGFWTLIGLGRVNHLKSQVFEWVKDSQGITSVIITLECSSLDWNKRVFSFGVNTLHLLMWSLPYNILYILYGYFLL